MVDNISVLDRTILLHHGKYFSYERPDLSDFSIYDIAQGLSNTCRFSGQCARFYSVAEHSVHVSYLVPPALALAALMHDAAEAFICDIPKPLKLMLPDYKIIEDRVEAAIAARFGLDLPMAPEIKRADRMMLATEQLQVMHNYDAWDAADDIGAADDIVIESLDPPAARALFLLRFQILGGHQAAAAAHAFA